MGVCIFVALFCSVSLVISASASANITSSTGDAICIGESVIFVCSVNGSGLRWNYEGSSALYSASSTSPRFLNPFQAEFISVCNGDVVSSSATVNVSDSVVADAVNGTTIFCDNPLSSTDVAANFTININELRSISYLMIQYISRNEMILDWGGAQCVSHYIIDVNGVTVDTTTETSYRYMIPRNEATFMFTVHGVNYAGNIFTTISEPFNLTGPDCSAFHILADNGTLFIVIESENLFQLPITENFITFDSVSYNRSETDGVVGFDVTPGESYNYSVVIGNYVGSTVCGSDSVPVPMDLSPSVSPSSTATAEPQSELPAYALPVMIFLAILLIVAVLIITVLLYIIWKLWSIQEKNNKRVATANLRTQSPDGKETASL